MENRFYKDPDDTDGFAYDIVGRRNLMDVERWEKNNVIDPRCEADETTSLLQTLEQVDVKHSNEHTQLPQSPSLSSPLSINGNRGTPFPSLLVSVFGSIWPKVCILLISLCFGKCLYCVSSKH
jgi:hypothetical protein